MQNNGFEAALLVDFHAHVLPRADHGSDSLSTSLFQLSAARDAGVKRVVATPHFYPARHTVEYFLERRSSAYDALAPHISDGYPELILGAEVLICPGIDHMEGIEKLCIGDTRTILIELPFSEFESSYCDVAYKLSSNGMSVVLAHADRYPKENIERMVSAGAKIQLNASSLATLFRRKHLYSWLSRGLVVALGSDIHGRDSGAYKAYIKALARTEPYLLDIMNSSNELLRAYEKIKAE